VREIAPRVLIWDGATQISCSLAINAWTGAAGKRRLLLAFRPFRGGGAP
jgi:hypothetical protein